MRINELKGLIVSKGLTQEKVAKQLNISPKTLSLKLKNEQFTTDEVNELIDILKIEDPMWIFFERKVTY